MSLKPFPLLLLFATLIMQPWRVWKENYDFFIHINGTKGFTIEWVAWILFAHYFQFFVYMGIIAYLLRIIKYFISRTGGLSYGIKTSYRIAVYSLNIFIAIALAGFFSYLYRGWPEYNAWVYIVGIISGFLFTIWKEQKR